MSVHIEPFLLLEEYSLPPVAIWLHYLLCARGFFRRLINHLFGAELRNDRKLSAWVPVKLPPQYIDLSCNLNLTSGCRVRSPNLGKFKLNKMSEILAIIATFMEKLTFCLLRFNQSSQIFTVVVATVKPIYHKNPLVLPPMINKSRIYVWLVICATYACLNHIFLA